MTQGQVKLSRGGGGARQLGLFSLSKRNGTANGPPEHGAGPRAVLLRNAVSNLMTQGQVHLISHP